MRSRGEVINGRGLQLDLSRGRQVTLVLGAGVNRARDLPLWPELLRQTWKAVFDEDPHGEDEHLLERARNAGRREGLPDEFLARLDVQRHPLEWQFGFEQVHDELWRLLSVEGEIALRKKLRLRRLKGLTSEQRVDEIFADILRRLLYRRTARKKRKEPDTLSLIANAVRREARKPEHQRRIAQVITFNVDDLLEREVNAGIRSDWRKPAVPIFRASAVKPLPSRRSIAVYHVHGFVPLNPLDYPYYTHDGAMIGADRGTLVAESLVFTDEQYWRAIGRPTGWASRVFAGALSGTCVFIGLSMTDINILRLLAQDAIERGDDLRRLTATWKDTWEAEWGRYLELARHYWIAEVKEKNGVVAKTLERRGVVHIAIPSWTSKAFHDWWRRCFALP